MSVPRVVSPGYRAARRLWGWLEGGSAGDWGSQSLPCPQPGTEQRAEGGLLGWNFAPWSGPALWPLEVSCPVVMGLMVAVTPRRPLGPSKSCLTISLIPHRYC